MFSRRFRICTLLLQILSINFILSACGLGLFEKKANPETLKLSSAEFGCLANASMVIFDYVESKASDELLSSAFNCADRALELFAEQTSGEISGLYKVSELRNFLKHYFLNGQDFSDSFYSSAMGLKAALVGGDSSAFSSDELMRTRNLLKMISQELPRAKGFFPLSKLFTIESSEARLDQASEVFVSMASHVGSFFESFGSRYSLTQVDALLPELAGIFPVLGKLKSKQALQLLALWKSIFFSGEQDVLEQAQWSRFLSESVRMFFLTEKFKHAHKRNNANYLCGSGHLRFVQLLNEAITDLTKSLSLRSNDKSAVIKFAEIEEILNYVPDSSIPISKTALKVGLRPLFKKIVRRQNGPLRFVESSQSSIGLTADDLRIVQQLLAKWSLGQLALDKLFARLGPQCEASLSWRAQYRAQGLRHSDLLRSWDDLSGAHWKSLSTADRSHLQKFKQFLIFAEPLWELDRPAIQLGKSKRDRYSWLELSLKNAAFVGLGATFEAYGARNAQVTQNQLENFYSDFKATGVALKLMDPRLNNWSKFRFAESNYLTKVSNGDHFVSLAELTASLPNLIAARSYALRMHDQAARKCTSLGLDLFARPIIEERCYYSFLYEHIFTMTDLAPAFVSYFRTAHLATRLELIDTFKDHMLPAKRRGVESSFSEVFIGILSFEELLLERYDLNRNGTLDVDESLRMVPIFKQLLIEKSGLSSTGDLDAVLTFTLSKGVAPTKNIGGIAEYIMWRLNRPFWSFEAPRPNVFKVFTVIGASPYLESPNF